MNYVDYARNIVSGVIPSCEYVRLSCKRFLDDLSNPDLEFKEDRIILFEKFASLLKHYKDDFAGSPVIFEPWQMMIVASIFGIYWKDTGTRKYKSSYIEVPRKSGKSFLAAVMCLYAFLCDGLGSEVLICANSAKQAFEVDFDTISKLAKQLDPKGKILKHYRDSIRVEKTASKLMVLAADSSRMDGFNCSFGLVDEYHEAPDSKVSDVIKSSMGMRKNPHLCIITTAGLDRNCVCYELRNYCIDVLKGVKHDDTIYTIIYTMDEGDDWTDENNWKKAMPNLGVTNRIETLREVVNMAKQFPSKQNETKTKQFDIWCDSTTVWIPENIVRSSVRKLSISDFMGNKDYLCYLGFDLASVSDLTALSVMFVNPSTGEYYFINKYYLPRKALDGKYNSELYRYWSSKGYLTLTDSPTTDYNHIKGEIMYLYDNFDVQGIFYDSWNAQQLVNDLTSEGLPMYPYSQSIGNFNKPTREFERLILSGCITMDDNPINRFCMDNVELKMDINGNAKPVGDHKSRKIDGVISMLNALGGYLNSTYSMGSAFVLPLNG